MKITKGDLTQLAKQGSFDVIIHGCNCFHAMGAGIALAIKKEFPQAYRADLNTPKRSKAKLGDYSVAKITLKSGKPLWVVNAYTQYRYGRDKVHLDYNALKSVFEKIKRDFSTLKIGYPLIGCGLAGGDWNKAKEIINTALEGEDHTLVVYSP